MSLPEVVVDVTGRVPVDGHHHISTWMFAPSTPRPSVPLLFCLPGGSYTKAYWHLEVPGHPGYSFAEHLAAKGMLVIAVDHMGTGDSSRYPRAAELTPEVVTAANAVALADILERAAAGTLTSGVPALDIGPVVGVGHSMGAMLTIFQQSLHGSFDAIALLGYGTIGPIIDWGGDVGLPMSYEAAMATARSGTLDGPVTTDRSIPQMRHHFYWEDVPSEVIAADDLTVTPVPGVTGLLSVVPFIASDHAGRIRCPVFIGLGERDSTPSHHDEPRAYYSSNDITFFLLPRSGHCHNTAGTRAQLWDRLARWIEALQMPVDE